MMTDPIADMLARIRNASLARHETTRVPSSKLKAALLAILKQEGYIADVRADDNVSPIGQHLTVTLKYGRDKRGAFEGIRRVSRPGRKVYVGHDEIPRVLSGLGVSILSTSQGLMTDKEARRRRVGGELLCEVW